MRRARRLGSVLVLVLWMLVGVAAGVYALHGDVERSLTSAHVDFRRACARRVAEGGLHYTLAAMRARHPGAPEELLDEQPPPRFYHSHAGDEMGWFIAETPYPVAGDAYGVRAEQGRMPLSNLTESALAALFPDRSRAERVASYIASCSLFPRAASRQAKPVGRAATHGRPDVPEAPLPPRLVRGPADLLELLAVDGVTHGDLLGEDWNGNGVRDPHEPALSSASGRPGPLTRLGGFEVDRGLQDAVTAFTDGRFAPLDAAPEVREAYLAAWPGPLARLASARRTDDLAALAPRDRDWKKFALLNLVSRPTYFRVPVFGTFRGQPLWRLRVVVETVTSPRGASRPGEGGLHYRVIDWRQDEPHPDRGG